MFLSNPRLFFLLAIFWMTIFQACGPSQTNENKPVSLTDDSNSEFPFSTHEPEVYQGDFVVTYGKTEDHKYLARNGDKWRIDFFRNNEPSQTQIKTDRLYYIDHQRKVYATTPENGNTVAGSGPFGDIGSNLFRGKEYREFDEIGRDGSLVRYRVRPTDDMKDDIVISVDAPSGMIVREEFRGGAGQTDEGSQPDYIYDVRNLKFEVDDSVFAIPAGYRKVTWKEYRPPKPNR